MNRLTLSQRLFLVVCFSVAPSFLILGMTFLTLRGEADRRLRDEATNAAQFAKLEMSRIIGGVESVLRSVATTPMVMTGGDGSCDDYLRRVTALSPQLSDLAIADAQGNVVCKSGRSTELISIADRDYFQDARNSTTLVTGTFSTGRLSGRMTLPFAFSLGPDTAWPRGVIAGGLDLAWLQSRLKERDFTRQNALTIADRNGTILAREPFPENFVGKRIPDAYIHLVRAEAPGTLPVTSQDGTQRVIGYVPVSVGYGGVYVGAGVASDAIYAATNRLILQGALVALVGIASSLLLATITSYRAIRSPFRRLIATAEAWQRDELRIRTGMANHAGEFGRAARALDTFMDQLTLARDARREAESQRETLAQELDHRIKNILATVQAIARQTFRGQGLDESVRSFNQRLQAMSRAHSVLMQDGWQSAAVAHLVSEASAPFIAVHRTNFRAQGPDIVVTPRAAMSLSMALHELCTNAAKYGALSNPTGDVFLCWRLINGDEGPLFEMTWTEIGGPVVEQPTRKGFGSRMIEQVLAQQLGGSVVVEYRADGLRCRITASQEAVLVEESVAEPSVSYLRHA